MIDTDDTGDDMRGCKRLVSDHTAAEAELGAVEQKVANISFLVLIYIFCFQGRRPQRRCLRPGGRPLRRGVDPEQLRRDESCRGGNEGACRGAEAGSDAVDEVPRVQL